MTDSPEKDSAGAQKRAGSRERAVEAIGTLYAAVPSLSTAKPVWERLGFATSAPYVLQGCRAFDVPLPDCGVTVVCPDSALPEHPFGTAVHDRLEHGAALIGWSWECRSPARTRAVVEQAAGVAFESDASGSRSFVVPPDAAAGSLTTLVKSNGHPAAPPPNAVSHVDHFVIMCGDADATAGAMGANFRLKPVVRDMKKGRYGFCKVGRTVIEIVGPAEPEKKPPHLWGITFGSDDLGATVAAVRARGVELPDPHPAIQGGRITSLPTAVAGIQIAFLGD